MRAVFSNWLLGWTCMGKNRPKVTITENEWYCYVCGERIEKQFVLASMTERTDRVFLVHGHCAEQLDQVITLNVGVEAHE